MFGPRMATRQIAILYKVCTVDLAFYALLEFYAFSKSVT
jgi:hypothetical protein